MSLLSLVPGLGALRAIGIGLMFAGVTTITGSVVYYFKGKTAGRAEVQAVLDKAVAEHNAAALAASEAYRLLQEESRQRILKAEAKYFDSEAANAKKLASVRAAASADYRILLDRITELASGSQASTDPSAPESDGATAIGEVLGDALRNAAEATAAAESNADAYRSLLESWPD